MRRTPEGTQRTGWPLRIAAGLLFALAALLAGTVQVGARGPLSIQVPFRTQAAFVANVDVAVLTYRDGAWTIDTDGQSSVGVAPGEDWHVQGGPRDVALETSGRTAVGIPFAIRGDRADSFPVSGSVTPAGLVVVYGISAGWESPSTSPRVRAPKGTWLVGTRPRGSEPVSGVAAWRELVVRELELLAAAPASAPRPLDADALCLVAVLLGATEAREPARGLWPHATSTDIRNPAASLLLCREDDPPPHAAVERLARSDGTGEVLIRVLAESPTLAAPVREAANALLLSRRSAHEARARQENIVYSGAALVALALLAIAAMLRPHDGRRRPLAMAALVGGGLLAAERVPAAWVVPAPAIGLAVAAGALACVSRARRMLVAAGAFALAALGHAIGGVDVSFVPDTMLGALAFAGLVLVPAPPPVSVAARAWPHRPPQRPAHSRGALSVVLAVFATIGLGLLAALLITEDAWLDWLWPRSVWDISVALAGAPIVGRLIALDRPLRTTIGAIMRTIAVLYLAALHANAMFSALFDAVPPSSGWMPRDVGITVLYLIVAISAIVRLARWRAADENRGPSGDGPLLAVTR